MDYEYVALSYCTQQPHWDAGFVANRNQLLKEGWQGFVRASWRFPKLKGLGGACIMRRPKDGPRMWTEKEIREVAKGTEGSVLNERAMQADLIGRLGRRNAELQAAIDEVVAMSEQPSVDRSNATYHAVRCYLYPRATKKEINE